MILRHSRLATGHVGLVGSARTGRLSGVSKSGLPGFGKDSATTKDSKQAFVREAGNGCLVAQLIVGRETEIPIEPFDPKRYL